MAISKIKIGDTIHDIEAVKIGTENIGSTTRPVYIKSGTPTAISTVAVGYGGTGATTAAGARTNLDVYSKSEANNLFKNTIYYCSVAFGDEDYEPVVEASWLEPMFGYQRQEPEIGDLAQDDDGDFFNVKSIDKDAGKIYLLRLTETDRLGTEISLVDSRVSQIESVIGNSIIELKKSSGQSYFNSIEEALGTLASLGYECAIYIAQIDICTGDDKVLINWCSGCGDHAIVITNDAIYYASLNNDQWVLESIRDRLWALEGTLNSLKTTLANLALPTAQAWEKVYSGTLSGFNEIYTDYLGYEYKFIFKSEDDDYSTTKLSTSAVVIPTTFTNYRIPIEGALVSCDITSNQSNKPGRKKTVLCAPVFYSSDVSNAAMRLKLEIYSPPPATDEIYDTNGITVDIYRKLLITA